MVTAYRANEISSDLLLKGFLKEIFLDPEIAPLVGRHLIEKGIEERSLIISALSMTASLHRKAFEEMEPITKK
jgi:hypothetical protein